MLKSDGFQSTAEIDARLAELEQEKKQHLALREQLQQPPHQIHLTHPYIHQNKRLPFLEDCFGAEPIFLLTAGKINKVAVVTLLPAITSGSKESVTSLASNIRTAITVNSQS